MKKAKICVICVYFGKFSNYFSLWLKSCQFNPTIDFLLVTDQTLTISLPTNVHLFPYTLDKMRKRATQVLGFPAILERPYKCCDYRPIYGLIFAEQLREYDYWGHCDMDMIFGDIRFFTDKYQLEKYDKFLPLGHLSLYRNTLEVNQRYKLDGAQHRNYLKVYSTDKSCIFDEIPGMYSIYKKHNFPMFTKRIFVDVASIFTRYRIIENTTFDISSPHNYKQQIFYWENGKVYHAYAKRKVINHEEYIYIHFKKRKNFNVNFPVKDTSSFYITSSGFHPKNGNITLQDICKFEPYSLFTESYEVIRNMIRKGYEGMKRIVRNLLWSHRI